MSEYGVGGSGGRDLPGWESAGRVEEGGCAVEGVEDVVYRTALLFHGVKTRVKWGRMGKKEEHTSIAPSFPWATHR